MVDMKLSNVKLVERGVRMVMEQTGCDAVRAQQLLTEYGSVRRAVNAWRKFAG
jgi:N-acetylmuramic acid 6-phosphate etherase